MIGPGGGRLDLSWERELRIWPANSNLDLNLVSGAIAGTFSAWAPIVDVGLNNFDDSFVDSGGRITGFFFQNFTFLTTYYFEISQGTDHKIITRARVNNVAGAGIGLFLPVTSLPIEQGEPLYWRMMSTNGAETLGLSIYYLNDNETPI